DLLGVLHDVLPPVDGLQRFDARHARGVALGDEGLGDLAGDLHRRGDDYDLHRTSVVGDEGPQDGPTTRARKSRRRGDEAPPVPPKTPAEGASTTTRPA